MRLEPGESVVVGPSDARRGIASFDVEPIVMLRRPPALRAWFARLRPTWSSRLVAA